MSYFDKFDAQETKLENILEDKYLLHKFRTDTYPMSLTITQNQTPDAQMALYENETDGVSSQDAKLVLTFPVGEIGVRVYGRLVIPEQLLNKIKNCGKKMRDLYLQADFAQRKEAEKERGGCTPPPTTEDVSEEDPDFAEFMEDDSDSEDSED